MNDDEIVSLLTCIIILRKVGIYLDKYDLLFHSTKFLFGIITGRMTNFDMNCYIHNCYSQVKTKIFKLL